MRFDDRLATALGQPADVPAARQVVWRQLVDLLSQGDDEASELRDLAFERLRQWRGEVPIIGRQSAAMLLLGDQPVPTDLIEFFAEDATVVFAPLLAGVELPGKVWRKLIPRLSPVARALLRHRRDLPNGALRALEAFGPADLVIEGPAAPELPPEPEAAHEEHYAAPDIRELRARIDAFRERQLHAELTEQTEFSFETGADGVIRWCDAAARGAIVGLSIADAAPGQAHGVDGQAAGAFRRRAPFRDARLTVARAGPAGGAWCISGVPSFDAATGRFTGYRGTARRPRVGERAEDVGLLGSALSGDSLRQLAHEVRTPLNAIAGFAEMIERQMLGPAPRAYRDRATAILEETQRLQDVLDDLNEAAQLDGGVPPLAAEEVDCAMLLARVTSALGPLATDKKVTIALAIAPHCASVMIDPGAIERMATRLVSAAIGLARPGERIAVELAPGDGAKPETLLAVERPALVTGQDEASLFEACDIAGEEEGAPPLLGLGFTLRMVRGVARSAGGDLAIAPDRFRVRLPAVAVQHAPRPAEHAACSPGAGPLA
ncbi:putative two-component histidine kinase [Sphingomonas changbaiensis NBRC 104936]|uniref:histidine kinase n=1 Tax=Sphingomonas changbaiensis NBRC 104936 TaxID=1219043 RepID=A0A0E9MMW0_9SPHN|nr:HAMP domain-containing sensor histidine kinase [Sphingomonas changbaiensis]GAO38766.1 putative two-component histidine kinase [Sphingomonas changbaiensis NBRC 104936]